MLRLRLSVFSVMVLSCFYSARAGQWVPSHMSNGRNINSVAILDPNVIVVAGGNERNDSIESVFSSNTYGLLWNFDILGNISSGLSSWITSIAFKDSLNGYGVGFNGKMIYTNNGGSVWAFGNTPVIRHWNKVVYAGVNTLFAAGGWQRGDSIHPDSTQTIIKSNDGGNTWSVVYDSLGPWLTSISFADSLKGVAVGQSGTILSTPDGGITWHKTNTPVNRDFGGITFVNADTGYIVGGQPVDSIRTILRTADQGNTWSVLRDEPGGYLTDISFSGKDTGYVVGAYATLLRSTNSGINWIQETVTGTTGIEYFTSVKFKGSDLGAIGTLNGKVYLYFNIPMPLAYTVGALPTDTSVTLTGTLNTRGAVGQYLFTYSTDPTFSGAINQTLPVGINCNSLYIASSQVQHLLPGNTYYYFFSALNPSGTVCGDTLSFYTGAPSSSIVTQGVSGVTGHSATLQGLVQQLSAPVNLFFEYDTTPHFGHQVTAIPASVNDAASHSVNAAISGLLPGRTYFYRLKGIDAQNQVYEGNTEAFYTGTGYSLFQTLLADSVTDSTANLEGMADGLLFPATITFQLDTSIAFNSEVPANPGQINDTASTLISQSVAGLLPHTIYYYRMKAQTPVGDLYSNTMDFYTGKLYADFETLSANNLTINSANLNGQVEGISIPTTLQFEYGLTLSLGDTIASSPSLVSDTALHGLHAQLSNLLANSVYYYRLSGYAGSYFIQGDIHQFYVGDCEVPNCDFEAWNNIYNNQPLGWNIVGSVLKVPSYNGTSAVQLTGGNVNTAGGIILGYPAQHGIAGGVPYTGRPDSVSLHAKYNIVTGDTAFAFLNFKKNGNSINQVYVPITGNSGNNWVSLHYPTTCPDNNVPDTLLGGVVSTNVFGVGGAGTSGSILTIDDLVLTGTSQNLPNGNFELWDTLVSQQIQTWSSDVYNSELNDSAINLQKTTDRVSGNYAVKLQTDAATNPYVNLSTGANSSSNHNGGPTFALSARHNSINMYVRFLPTTGDTLYISLYLYYQGNYIGGASLNLDTSLSQYTPLSLPINYFQSNLGPDSATVSFQLGTGNAAAGSIAYIDNISFDGYRVTGLQPNLLNSLRNMYCSIYPNPARSTVYIDLLQSGDNNVVIYDIHGKEILSKKFNSSHTTVDVSSFGPGEYQVLVNPSSGNTATQKIVIIH